MERKHAQRKQLVTEKGNIRYWVNDGNAAQSGLTLVFLPGLTADHTLFDKQWDAFEGQYRLLVWDAPGHGVSRPFALDFDLMQKAVWLHEILQQEKIENYILIGQSMGGYVSQCFIQRYPGEAAGFISIDSAPLQRKYVTAAEIWLLAHVQPVYDLYPWGPLIKAGTEGCSETEYGRALMRTMMQSYEKQQYCRLAGHGYGMLAAAMKADLPYRIDCPALLLCGVHDRAGSTKNYNKRWTKESGLPLTWIEGAGHNSNTDNPEAVNHCIAAFITQHGLARTPQQSGAE